MNENEETIRELFEIANSHAPDALDRIQLMVADDMTYSSPVTGPTDKNGMRGVHSAFWSAFPDFVYSVQRMIGQGDTVIVESVFKGDHEGELMGIKPTNRNVAVPLAFVIDFKDGKIQRWNSYFDVASVLRQVGAMP